jgi:unsaturated rhamnogalacturonyl hydrolase
MNKTVITLLLLVTTGVCKANIASIATGGEDSLYRKKYVKEVMLKVFNWQNANPVAGNAKDVDDWARAVYYSGMMRAYKSTKNKAYLNEAMRWSESLNYKLGRRHTHADDHTRGQTFAAIYQYKKDKQMISDTRAVYDSLMANPKPGKQEWWWCDALFMSPPVLAKLGKVTGDSKYTNYMNAMWWDTTDFLFDKTQNLYYRDKSFFDKRTARGKKIFWSRGNGWVMGGLVQVLEDLPKSDAYYNRYADLYKKMAAKIATLQQPDGLWRASLLDAEEVTNKETSGSAFYVFALAWGINNNYLDAKTYLPVVKKGWEALLSTVEPSGKLTWVQRIGSKPDAVKESDNQEYGSGAFLMAGTEIMKLKVK